MSGPPVKARPTDADLRRLYVDEGRTCPEIARGIGCDPTTVHYWLKAAGIPTRPRGNLANMGGKRRAPGWRPTPAQVENVKAATIRRGGVPYLKDGKHWLAGKAPQDNPNWKGGVTAERQAFYNTKPWKVACVAVYARTNGFCERCGTDSRKVKRTPRQFHIHHIVSFAVEALRAEPSNLALLCRDCHFWVHSRANVDRVFLRAAEREASVPSLFDMLDEIGEAA